ncbi:hypothetical protein B0T24DRAFT_685308 [Lasiosphaeria ovina]|uniref:Myb/SANT-like domain-containing protein n=1 Tax=Lasiosphaeria ovina TaxID=92902 RepID=A0AAE0MXN9_9PEZI|nr:hypothetical protein B0T24DRAFT_685308 [Lasiosphaeria ovina]
MSRYAAAADVKAQMAISNLYASDLGPNPDLDQDLPDHCTYTTWPSSVKRLILECMNHCVELGLRPRGIQFKPEAYIMTAAEVGKQAQLKVTRWDVRSIMKYQRQRYRHWLELGEKHGARWDGGLRQWILSPAQWDALVAERPEMKQFRGRTLLWLDLLEKLWGGPYRPVVPAPRQRRQGSTAPRYQSGSSSSSSSSSG